MDSTRVDRWLWSVRIFKTRTMATDACHGGHVEVNHSAAKPATKVKVGDHVTVRSAGHLKLLEVARVIEKRVGAAVAAECIVDHSPPPPDPEFVAPVATRERGAGRPTKRDRRTIDRFRAP